MEVLIASVKKNPKDCGSINSLSKRKTRRTVGVLIASVKKNPKRLALNVLDTSVRFNRQTAVSPSQVAGPQLPAGRRSRLTTVGEALGVAGESEPVLE